MADMDFELKIVTPNRIMYTHPVERIIFQSTEGEMAVLKGHIPLTTIIASSVVRISLKNEEGEKQERLLAVHEGFIEIRPEQVTILTESAEWPEEIDVTRAEEARKRAEQRLSKKTAEIDALRAEMALKRSLIRLETSKHVK